MNKHIYSFFKGNCDVDCADGVMKLTCTADGFIQFSLRQLSKDKYR